MDTQTSAEKLSLLVLEFLSKHIKAYGASVVIVSHSEYIRYNPERSMVYLCTMGSGAVLAWFVSPRPEHFVPK